MRPPTELLSLGLTACVLCSLVGCSSVETFPVENRTPFSYNRRTEAKLARDVRLLQREGSDDFIAQYEYDPYDAAIPHFLLPAGSQISLLHTRLVRRKVPLKDWIFFYLWTEFSFEHAGKVRVAKFNHSFGAIGQNRIGDPLVTARYFSGMSERVAFAIRPAPWESLDTPANRVLSLKELVSPGCGER